MHRKKTPTNVPTSFLQKTYEILCDNSLSAVASWTDDGKAFAVKNVKEFCDQVLPKYFKHNNFASFVRQLNMYDFHKLRDEENVFRHPLFQRDKQHLLKEITRKTNEAAVMPRAALSNADCWLLQMKLNGLHSHQQKLEEQIAALQQKYGEIRLQNQLLIKELLHAQEREQRIEKLLVLLASFITNRQTADYSSWRRTPQVLAISPESPDRVSEFPDLFEEDPIDYFLNSQQI